MFDVWGAAAVARDRLPPRDLTSVFSASPWSRLPAAQRATIQTPNLAAVWLRRSAELLDYAGEGARHIFIVGEVFTRDRGPLESGMNAHRADAEQLLAAYGRRGTSAFDSLKGNFIVVVIDHHNEHQIFSSRLSVVSLYYAVLDGVLYFSTSLGQIGTQLPASPRLDATALAEVLLLNFPLGQRTFLQSVSRMPQSAIVRISQGSVSCRRYWELTSLYHLVKLPERDALDHGAELFHRIANTLAMDQPRVCASFTSGFDSRALHAVLDEAHATVLGYSFGRQGTQDVVIPLRISQELGYSFLPVYLDDEYESAFPAWADLTITLSDGLVVERANYPYAFDRLSSFSPVVLTGLYGSELLRTFQNVGTVVSECFVRLNRAHSPVMALREWLVNNRNVAEYIQPKVMEDAQLELEADVDEWFNWARGYNFDQRLYLYLLSEVDRKYFAAETATERIYATNRMPFLDEEFVEYVFRSPFGGVYSRTITPSVENRFRSQRFYVHLIQRYQPKLLRYKTGHGYSPGDLIGSGAALRVGAKFVLERLRNRLAGEQAFRPVQWLTPFYATRIVDATKGRGVVAPRFYEAAATRAWQQDRIQFNKVAALHLWLDQLGL